MGWAGEGGGDVAVYEQTLAERINNDSIDWACSMLEQRGCVGEALNNVAQLNSSVVQNCTTFKALVNSSEALSVISKSSTVMRILAVSTAAMSHVTASSSAMDIIVNSDFATDYVYSSPVALAEIYKSTAAYDTIMNNEKAKAAFLAISDNAATIGKALAMIVSFRADTFDNVSGVAASQAAMTAVAASEPAMLAAGNSSHAMSAFALSQLAMTTLGTSVKAIKALARANNSSFISESALNNAAFRTNVLNTCATATTDFARRAVAATNQYNYKDEYYHDIAANKWSTTRAVQSGVYCLGTLSFGFQSMFSRLSAVDPLGRSAAIASTSGTSSVAVNKVAFGQLSSLCANIAAWTAVSGSANGEAFEAVYAQ